MKRVVPTLRGTARIVRQAVANAGPGWFTSVMGTGILAICLVLSPIAIPFGRTIATLLWSADTLVFLSFALLWLANGIAAPKAALSSLLDPVTAQAWGAPPMACFTIAVGFLKIGAAVLPAGFCVTCAQGLFIAGVAGSLWSALSVPYLMFTRHELTSETTFGSWLLPVVPPIVASVPAALLSPFWPAAVRGDVLALAYALLGTGMLLAAIIIAIFYSRLLYHKVPGGALVTTMWIVVGPLGQSIAGLIALGTASRAVWPDFAHGLVLAAMLYGMLVWGFALYWLTLAIGVTLRAARKHLPFTLGWWAFTFPVGVLTAGTDALYGQTHADIFAFASIGLIALLTAMWVIVAVRSLRGVVIAATAPPAVRLGTASVAGSLLPAI